MRASTSVLAAKSAGHPPLFLSIRVKVTYFGSNRRRRPPKRSLSSARALPRVEHRRGGPPPPVGRPHLPRRRAAASLRVRVFLPARGRRRPRPSNRSLGPCSLSRAWPVLRWPSEPERVVSLEDAWTPARGGRLGGASVGSASHPGSRTRAVLLSSGGTAPFTREEWEQPPETKALHLRGNTTPPQKPSNPLDAA
jgi:hypothetical protein